MIIEFKYSAEDFKEAVEAKVAVLGGTQPGSAKPQAKMKFRRGFFGWLLFVGLSVALFYMKNINPSARVPRSASPRGDFAPTHNFLQTLAVASISPLLLTAFIALVVAKGMTQDSVPFYAAKRPSNRIALSTWRIISIICVILAITTLVAVFNLPTAPDWRPDLLQLLLVMIGPWLGWLIILGLLVAWLRQRAKRRMGSELFAVEGSSILELQQMEASENGILLSSPQVAIRFNWLHFVSYVESENLLTLYTRDLTMRIIPKRAFAEAGSFERLCGLVQTRIPAGLFLPRQSAFSVITPVPVLPIATDDTRPGSEAKL